jgi:hypothetical protein
MEARRRARRESLQPLRKAIVSSERQDHALLMPVYEMMICSWFYMLTLHDFIVYNAPF